MPKVRPNLEKGNRKLLNAWAFYDWANSVYPLIITSAVFPIFYNAIFKTEGGGASSVLICGVWLKNTALITFVTALAFLVISIISPILSGIADYIGNKKIFMRLFSYLGALSCVGLYWFSLEHIYLSLMFYFLGLVGFWGSLVFYNSYLPDIAHKDQQDAVSSKGFALGYLGSVILLIFSLAMVMFPEMFGITKGHGAITAMRYTFVFVGVWWIAFSQYSYFYLPKGVKKNGSPKHVIYNGFRELKHVYRELKDKPELKKYLLSFFVYSMGVQTVMLVATYFGEQEIAWGSDGEKTTGLIVSILIIQFIAVLGAILTAKASKKFGNIKVLVVLNVLWLIICLYAFTIHRPVGFFTAAALVGLVMGGIQSLSRSTYSKLLPETSDTTSFFSFYDVAEKIALVIGLGLYGIIDQVTGSMRNAVLVIAVFFLIGCILLLRLLKSSNATGRNH